MFYIEKKVFQEFFFQSWKAVSQGHLQDIFFSKRFKIFQINLQISLNLKLIVEHAAVVHKLSAV